MTNVMKQAELENRMQTYKQAIVRFHFPDKLVMQAVFRPRETGDYENVSKKIYRKKIDEI